jgi:hypothetical protein
VEAAAVPSLQNCQQNLAATPYNGFQPLAYGVFLPQAQFRSGANKLCVFAFDRSRQTVRADVSVTLPSDFRIAAMEVTQGIQKTELPMNTNGTAQYSRTRLRSSVPTVTYLIRNKGTDANSNSQ